MNRLVGNVGAEETLLGQALPVHPCGYGKLAWAEFLINSINPGDGEYGQLQSLKSRLTDPLREAGFSERQLR